MGDWDGDDYIVGNTGDDTLCGNWKADSVEDDIWAYGGTDICW